MRGIAGGKTVDPLYGLVGFDPAVDGLISSPVIQRLRHVRLSNIDSLDMPGVANVSRFEHVVGTAYLAQRVSQNLRLTGESRLRLVAAALLHDWAISSYGHLVEEALQYAGTGFDHELLWRQIESDEKPEEIGGIERQVLVGRALLLLPARCHVGLRCELAQNRMTETTQFLTQHGKLL